MSNCRALTSMLERACQLAPETILPRGTIPGRLYQRSMNKVNGRKKDPALRDVFSAALRKEAKFEIPLMNCAALVMSYGCESDLVFVGRSPESLFDLFSGLLYDTPFKKRLTLLQFSMRDYADSRIDWQRAKPAIKSYMRTINLDPHSIAKRPRTITFVDLVATGMTFKNLINLLKDWSLEDEIDWSNVKRKIRIIGICGRGKPSPKAVAWNEEKGWVGTLPSGAIKNAVIDWDLWDYLGNRQLKSTTSFSPDRWGCEKFSSPIRNVQTLTGLCSALYWFEHGMSDGARKRFAGLLSMTGGMRKAGLRDIVLQLRKTECRKDGKKKVGSRSYSKR